MTNNTDFIQYLKDLRLEVQQEIEYYAEVEGHDIPPEVQDKILQPIDFRIAQHKLKSVEGVE